ncbi:ATP-binding cassette domain-containing protein [Isoptericola sp. b490]|uniref:ABC transporter ATP-binding protein n=1 Tax=Actinotalea lenta TaxID=3064654 RepID=UPI0027138AD8|nr:ATP-binding cassette domain-containing protein [Isoptericola sp. b490]MDO8119762.1 ATP-binding cassette domain-containing protein [Isoptericola sp. b490]
MTAVVDVRGLSMWFGGVAAVRDVDLRIEAGERRAVLGPNGAGKTTTFNLIAGTTRPTAGSISLFGQEVTKLDARRRTRLGLARTFQTSRLLSGLTVEENIYLAFVGVRGGRLRMVRGRPDSVARVAAAGAARRVGLGDRLGVLAGDLSHGEQRQLEIALALVTEPRLLLLDEPAAGLSRAERVLLVDLLLGLESSVTLVIIEHDMNVALAVAQKVTMMHEGAVIMEGTPDEVRSSERIHSLYLGRGDA